MGISKCLLCLSLMIVSGYCSCAFDPNLIATWTSNAFDDITFTSDTMTLGQHQFSINGQRSSDWTCYNDASSTYTILRSELFKLNGEDVYAYICMSLTMVNSDSYYFYMNSPTQNLLSNERIVIYKPTDTPGNLVSAMCTGTPSTAEFVSMVRKGSEENAVTNCPDPLHRNFTYTHTDSSNVDCATSSILSVCPDRQVLSFSDLPCGMIAYSADGRIGCVASIDGGSGTWYVSLYNFDTTVNNLNTFHFSCAAVEDVSVGDVHVSYTVKRCLSNQDYSARPSGGGLLKLIPNGSCAIEITTEATTEGTTEEETTTEASTTTESPIPVLTTENVNVGAIIGGIFAALFLIFFLLFLVLYCIHRKKVIAKQREIIDRRLKLFKIKQAQGLDDDEKVLTEPSLDPDFSPHVEQPKQTLIPPVKKFITRDMMSQTDLHKVVKKMPPTFETEKPRQTPRPTYYPWPWRTAKRAAKKSMFETETISNNKFGPLTETTMDCVSLANYTISKYGLKYDDTGVEDLENKVPRPPSRFIPRAQSFQTLSRALSRTSLFDECSVKSLQRSTSMEHIPSPTPRVVTLTRASSSRSLKSFTERTETNVLMPIEEKKGKDENIRQTINYHPEDGSRPIPHYMFPIRSRTVTRFDKIKNQNPLAKPLKRSKTDLKPITAASKPSKSKGKKKKKLRVAKNKKSPYSIIQPVARQVTLLPLNRQKNTSKVKHADIPLKQIKVKGATKKSKTPESNFTSPNTETKSPRTTESFYTQSPDTAISNNTKEEVPLKNIQPEENVMIEKELHTSIQNNSNQHVDDKSRITSSSEIQDSGISADESSSLGKAVSDDTNEIPRLKLPNINTSENEAIHNKTKNEPETKLEDSFKLPALEPKEKTRVRPWR